MTDRQLMQQALDALKLIDEAMPFPVAKLTIKNLNERLAQPEQEQWDAIPAAFNEWWNADYDDTGNPYRKDSPAYWAWSGWKAASKQPEQEPVAWTLLLVGEHNGSVGKAGEKFVGHPEHYERVDVYKSPPQRTWVGLTDAELTDMHAMLMVKLQGCYETKDLYKAIEAKLKEKNNG